MFPGRVVAGQRVRPIRPRRNPLPQQLHLSVGQVFPLRRHDFILIVGRDAAKQFAFRAVSRNDGPLSGLAAPVSVGPHVEAQPGFVLSAVVTGKTAAFEDRLDIARKIDTRFIGG
jgi:hypothetical protein